MGRQIARSADVVFCLTFAQLGSIGDERNVSKGGAFHMRRLQSVCFLSLPNQFVIALYYDL